MKASLNSDKTKASDCISFVKGKQPSESPCSDGLPYLTIDVLNGSATPSYSSKGVPCNENDVLMVMDGAASGRCFFGRNGYVGSTMAKIVCKGMDSSIVFFALSQHEKDIQDNTTGSAIPHTDKKYIGDLELPIIQDLKAVSKIKDTLKMIATIRKENSLLKQLKERLLAKYF